MAIDKQLLAFGGDIAGEPTDEICLADVSNMSDALAWREPTVSSGVHTLPSARKGMAAMYKAGKVYMYSGLAFDAKGEYVPCNDMYAITLSGNAIDVAAVEQRGAFRPAPRAGATFQDHSKDCIFLFGGMSADNKPLNDGWLFNVATSTWTCVYNGHPDMALPTGALGCLHDGKLVAINAAAGSPKLDIAACLDFEAVRAEHEFVPHMKAHAGTLLNELQEWVSKQQHGLAHPVDELSGDFKKLLETMAALYDVREAKDTKQLLIDQLHELFLDLAVHKVNTKKSLEQLEAVAAKLEAVQKDAPQVKEAVAPVQAKEGKRIRREIQDFTDKVNKYARDFRKFPFLTYATGPAASYAAMDKEVRCCPLADVHAQL